MNDVSKWGRLGREISDRYGWKYQCLVRDVSGVWWVEAICGDHRVCVRLGEE
jgi:hypothetical protein